MNTTEAVISETETTESSQGPSQEDPSSSDMFDFAKFVNDITRTMLFLTNPENRRVHHVNEGYWLRFRIDILRTVAVLCGVRRSTYGRW